MFYLDGGKYWATVNSLKYFKNDQEPFSAVVFI